MYNRLSHLKIMLKQKTPHPTKHQNIIFKNGLKANMTNVIGTLIQSV